jgi:hypothetical protein
MFLGTFCHCISTTKLSIANCPSITLGSLTGHDRGFPTIREKRDGSSSFQDRRVAAALPPSDGDPQASATDWVVEDDREPRERCRSHVSVVAAGHVRSGTVVVLLFFFSLAFFAFCTARKVIMFR